VVTVGDKTGGETIWRRFRRKAAARGLAPRQPAHKPGTDDVEALAAALNHSAERVQNLWFSFLIFMVYLAIATGTTTHRMLFLESPLNLPVLNISLPLLGFYILTPIIFVVFHFYILLNLVLLARTAKSFEDALERAFPQDGEAREAFRMRIENTLFVQLLVGGRLEREGINAKLLSLMALITLAIAPVALLLMIQIKFLPYHSEWITWLHRGLLALDLVLVWTLWPGYRSGWGILSWPKWSWRVKTAGVLTALALVNAVAVATFPDEGVYVAIWHTYIVPVNTLDLHGEDLVDDTKLMDITNKDENSTQAQRWVAILSLKGRDLTGVNLEGADIRHVDFAGAIINRANLNQARAKKAHFDNAQLQGASLDGAQLQGASLHGAQLQRALLRWAQLQGASLDGAQLQGAALWGVQLQGASLDGAQLQVAWLDRAQLQGASLDGAQLQGATLWDAQLQGASLARAGLQGAVLAGARLQGASLDGAQLQGALLDGARLRGASLDGAQLQGAVLAGARLQGASFVDVCTWRADAQEAVWDKTRVSLPWDKRKVWLPKPAEADEIFDECNLTEASFAELKQLIAKEAPGSDADERIENLDPAKVLKGEGEMAKLWAARHREAPTPEAYAKSLTGQWRELGCAAEGAPYVLHALVARLSDPIHSPFLGQSNAAQALAANFLDEAHCAGAHGLSEADKAMLKKIAEPPSPQAPKP
jgi:uncharacterized protein YjbI with pentapeptide repeats